MITEKQCKYQELALEIKQQCQSNKIIVIPLVSSATRIITNILNQSLTAISLPPWLSSQVQQADILNTYCIVGEFLDDDTHVSDEEAGN
jgi:hypothetical protein